MMREEATNAIIAAGSFLDSRGLAPATSGNYSARLADGTLAITVSGTHKGRLRAEDVMAVDATGKALENKKPSAETALHAQIYTMFPDVNAILHVHSVPGAVLTRISPAPEIVLEGYEMLKAFPGVTTHETRITVPVFENAQDMAALGAAVAARLKKPASAYIIRDHGFYAWGRDMDEAQRVAEALEYLLSCEIETLKIRAGARA